MTNQHNIRELRKMAQPRPRHPTQPSWRIFFSKSDLLSFFLSLFLSQGLILFCCYSQAMAVPQSVYDRLPLDESSREIRLLSFQTPKDSLITVPKAFIVLSDWPYFKRG
jgi:hypothetical protein